MTRAHGSAVLAFSLLCGACTDAPRDVTRVVRAHFVDDCRDGANGFSIDLEALGDFEASVRTSDAVPGTAQTRELSFPAATRAIEGLATSSRGRWLGIAETDGARDVDLLLLPEREACDLWRAESAAASPYPTPHGGEALGIHPTQRVALVAGGLVASSDAARALLFDLRTGSAIEVADGMLPGRAFATVTPFGVDELLVAGGVDPTLSPANPELSPPVGSAIVFDVGSASFDRASLIPLSQPRGRHAAVVLQSGDTLLLGGTGPTGLALATLELLSPADRAARIAGLATLKRPRVAPTALVLDDGRVFVAGGRDSLGASVHALEWLDAGATAVIAQADSVTLAPSASFAAMAGGGVLGVGVCATAPTCGTGVPCQRSCANRVVWIRADGTVDALPNLAFSVASSRLLPATDGAPWLVARATTGAAVLLRFEPWTGRFLSPPQAPSALPDSDRAVVAAERGVLLWLAGDGAASAQPEVRVRAFRHATRGPYARQIAPLLITDPTHVVPSRAAVGAAGIGYGSGGLDLSDENVEAIVTDTLYADVRLSIALTTGPAPGLGLGDVLVGGDDCPWPPAGETTPEVLEVERRGTALTLRRGNASRTCAGPSGRVDVRVAGTGNGPSRIRSLAIERLAP